MHSGIVYKSLNSGSYDSEILDVRGYVQGLPLIPML